MPGRIPDNLIRLLTMIKIMTTSKAALLAGLLSLFTTPLVSAEIIRFGLVSPEGHLWTDVMNQFKASVEKQLGDDFKVKESRQVKVRGESYITEMLANGQVQMAIVAVGGLTTFDPALNAWLVPYQFNSLEQLPKAARSEEARTMLANLGNYNLIGLGYAFSGMRQIVSKTPILNLDDFKNKRLTSFPNDVFYNWYRQLGADPHVVQIQDVMTELEEGKLDAVDSDLGTIAGLGLTDRAPNLILSNHMASAGIFVVAKKWWDAQTPERQAIITEAAAQAEQWGFDKLAQYERDHLKQLRDKGVKITELKEADLNGVPEKLRNFYSATNPRIKQFAEAL